MRCSSRVLAAGWLLVAAAPALARAAGDLHAGTLQFAPEPLTKTALALGIVVIVLAAWRQRKNQR